MSTATFAVYQEQFLERLSATLGMSYDQVVRHSYPDYSSPTFTAAKQLIERAAKACFAGQRGYRRKLKRARRLQCQASSWSVSNAWFSMQVQFAWERERRTQAAVMSAVMSAYIRHEDP